MTQFTTSSDTAGSYLSPGGSNGGVLAGAPSALQDRILQAVGRYEDATFFASVIDKQEAIGALLTELREMATTWPATRYFTDRAEYDRYTTLMEQAEERKS